MILHSLSAEAKTLRVSLRLKVFWPMKISLAKPRYHTELSRNGCSNARDIDKKLDLILRKYILKFKKNKHWTKSEFVSLDRLINNFHLNGHDSDFIPGRLKRFKLWKDRKNDRQRRCQCPVFSPTFNFNFIASIT